MPAIHNTNEVRSFIQNLKEWATENQATEILKAIRLAQYRGYTGPELIHEYLTFFTDFRSKLPSNIPETFRENWDQALKISQESLEL